RGRRATAPIRATRHQPARRRLPPLPRRPRPAMPEHRHQTTIAGAGTPRPHRRRHRRAVRRTRPKSTDVGYFCRGRRRRPMRPLRTRTRQRHRHQPRRLRRVLAHQHPTTTEHQSPRRDPSMTATNPEPMRPADRNAMIRIVKGRAKQAEREVDARKAFVIAEAVNDATAEYAAQDALWKDAVTIAK